MRCHLRGGGLGRHAAGLRPYRWMPHRRGRIHARIQAKYVIHAVGPIYAGRPRDAELLRSAYRSCLEEAEKLGLHSIGFCSISTGIYGYPLNEAVKIAADTLRTFPAKSLTDIRVYCYGEREYQAFTKALG